MSLNPSLDNLSLLVPGFRSCKPHLQLGHFVGCSQGDNPQPQLYPWLAELGTAISRLAASSCAPEGSIRRLRSPEPT